MKIPEPEYLTSYEKSILIKIIGQIISEQKIDLNEEELEQLSFTKNYLEKARNAMDEFLKNNGAQEQAPAENPGSGV